MDAGPRRKSDPYRVVGLHHDPDLPEDSPTRLRLGEAYGYVKGRRHWDPKTGANVTVVRPLDRRALLAVVFCVGGCGPDRSSGEILAHIWQTPIGFLYRAELVVAHDATPPFEEIYPDAILMWHPDHGGRAWVTQQAFDAFHRKKGWRKAPAGMPAPQPWRQQSALVVRDLLDVSDIEHPPLRVKCSRHPEALIDRNLLLGELARRAREHDGGKPIRVSLAQVAATRA